MAEQLLSELFGRRIELGPSGHADCLLDSEQRESRLFSAEPWDRWLSESGFTGTITDKAGHERHYQDGKEVAGPKAGASGAGAGTSQLSDGDRQEIAAATPDLAAEVEKADPEAAKRPGLLGRIKAAANKVMERAALLLVKHENTLDRVSNILGGVFDLPSDLNKFGYAPGDWTSGHEKHNKQVNFGDLPVAGSIGLSPHLTISLMGKVLVAAQSFVYKRLKARAQTPGRLESDQASEIIEVIHQLLTIAAEEFGVPPPTPDVVSRLVRARARAAK